MAMYTKRDGFYVSQDIDVDGKPYELFSSTRVAIGYTVSEEGRIHITVDGPPEDVVTHALKHNEDVDAVKIHVYIFGDNAPVETINRAIEDHAFFALLINV